VNRWHERSLVVRAKALSRSVSSLSRPTIGESKRRACEGAPGVTSSSR
jgi:hypothetical protein